MRNLLEHTASVVLLAVAVVGCTATANADGPVHGQWRTSFGTVTLEQTDDAVTGTYGNAGQFTLEGSVDGQKLTFEYQEGPTRGEATWTLDESGHAFSGQFQIRGGRSGSWQGWRPDPEATTGKQTDLGGLWLTDLGLMELEQTGDQVKGRYALRGVSEIEGTVTGRAFNFKYQAFRPGEGWFDVSVDGKTLAGAAGTDGFAGWYGWSGRRAPEFVHHVPLEPSKIVDGSTDGLLTYSVRAPDRYAPGDDKKWPAIVILHGSNMNGEAYVNTIAAAWPNVARKYLLIGINGERPSNTGDDPRFNFSYVNYVGRSTFKGYAGTDRESPALVAEALAELRDVYPITHYFVGGHSQGGFLTYSLLMNTPELIAGAFPISAGVIFQCEPTAYTDEPLRAAQRAVPLAIIHGRNDPLVNFSTAQRAAVLFGEAGWPALRFFADDTGAGHMFGRLPVDDAIGWLESHTSDDPAELLDFIQARMRVEGGTRDAVAALIRLGKLNRRDPLGEGDKKRFNRLARTVNGKAAEGAKELLPKVTENQDNGWIDDFLAYRDDFEFAPAAREVMKKFIALRAEHEEPAKKLIGEARAAFQQGRRDEGYNKYQEIVDKYYAASSYRNVKRWLAERE